MSKKLFINKGNFVLKDVVTTECKNNEILVEVMYSAFSSGTEFSEASKSGKSLLSRAIESPEKAKKAYAMLRSDGVKRTLNFIQETQLALQPTGYSVSGKVLSVGKDVRNFVPGMLVACSGAQFAHHSNYVKVTENLCVHVPDPVPLSLASTVTLGAIAIQGVRRAEIQIGHRVAIIGLGVIGQIVGQLCIAAGAKTLGLDIDEGRLALSKSIGITNCVNPKDPQFIETILDETEGFGVDRVIVCSADASATSMQLAFELARHRARVVMVGGVNLNLDRSLMYYKELDFVASMSYGPGRYERGYEELGVEYPLPYVRWTEGRNMSSYLEALGHRKEYYEKLIAETISFEDVPGRLNGGKDHIKAAPIILFDYQKSGVDGSRLANKSKIQSSFQPRRSSSQKLGVDVVGLGGHARQILLPAIADLKGIEITGVFSSDNAAVFNSQQKYNIEGNFASIDELFESNADAVIVSNRHSEHYNLIEKAVSNNRHVFCEKPWAVSPEDIKKLHNIVETANSTGLILFCGYNRAYSPHIEFLKKRFLRNGEPLLINYTMNAGKLKSDNWIYDEKEGGRVVGEAVHIFHLFCSLTNSLPIEINATPMSGLNCGSPFENFITTIKFENGSVCSLTYTSKGSKEFPKESFLVHQGGMTFTSANYTKSEIIGGRKFETAFSSKGHKEIIESFFGAILSRNGPMETDEIIKSLEIAFDVETMLRVLDRD